MELGAGDRVVAVHGGGGVVGLRLLQGDIIRSTWKLGFDDVELAEDELNLADLPLLFVVSRTLVVLATEEGPVGDIAGACFVAAEVIGDDLARSRLESVHISYSS